MNMTNSPRHQPPTPAELTVAELGALTVSTGRLTTPALSALRAALHNENLLASQLRSLLGAELRTQFLTGELTLCTRTPRNSPEGCPAHGLTWGH